MSMGEGEQGNGEAEGRRAREGVVWSRRCVAVVAGVKGSRRTDSLWRLWWQSWQP